MEIILKEDVIGLGYKNDIVNVKSGYGRNYLIPQGKGVIASPSAKKVLAENLRQQATVAAELAKKGIEIDRKIITMRDAKVVGDYEATVHFHKEVEVKVPVKVVAENAPEENKEEAAPAVVEEAPVAEAPVAEEEAPAEA